MKLSFEKYDTSKVEAGQIRSDGDTQVVMVIHDGKPEDDMFNVLMLTTGFKYNTLYIDPQDALAVERDFPKVINAREIKIITNEELQK